MKKTVDPFESIAVESAIDDFAELTERPVLASALSSNPQIGATIARFAGFDLQDQPLVADITCLPGQIVQARSVVALQRKMMNAQIVIMFEGGNPEYPIILGVIQDQKSEEPATLTLTTTQMPLHAQIDKERIEISAEREIVLRCGDASITLTRAGKVIIKGNYIVSRSAGYNKIKGAAIELN